MLDIKTKDGKINLFRIIIATLIFIALTSELIYVLDLARTPVNEGGEDIMFAPFYFLRYFTYTGNLVIAIGLLLIVFGRLDKRKYIHLVCFGTLILVVYGLLLSDGFIDEPWEGKILHYFAPALLLIDFTFFLDTTDYKYKDMPKYTILPLAYLVYTLIHGYFFNGYAYFFFDIDEVGLGGFFGYILAMAFGYIVLGLLFTVVKNKYDRTA